MEHRATSLTEERTKHLLFIAAICAGAPLLGMMVARQPSQISVAFIVTVLLGFFIVIAIKKWWLLMIPAVFAGGMFSVSGHDLQPQELGLALVFLGLLPALALNKKRLIQGRRALPLSLWLLGAYLICHLVWNLFSNKIEGLGGIITTARYHLYALWPIIFIALFQKYGSTAYIRAALYLLYGIFLVRAGLAFFNFFTGFQGRIPFINYLPPGVGLTSCYDLRYSAPPLALLAVCFFFLKSGFLNRCFQIIVFLIASVGVILGMGRTGLGIFFLVPIWWALVYRKYLLIPALGLLLLGVIALVNGKPQFLSALPWEAQRTLSIFLFDKSRSETVASTSTSDLWHSRLREIAQERWLQSPATIAFGTGIYRLRYDDTVPSLVNTPSLFEDQMQVAARSGAYESGYWCVLAVTGLVGLIFYLCIFWYLLRRLLPATFENRISDYPHAFVFVATFYVLIWLVLGWTFGNFPSAEIMLGYLAVITLNDQKSRLAVSAKKEGSNAHSLSVVNRMNMPRARLARPVGSCPSLGSERH